jgi:hypothetical protein
MLFRRRRERLRLAFQSLKPQEIEVLSIVLGQTANFDLWCGTP